MLNKIIEQLNSADISPEQFRDIVRSYSWRTYWIANKENIFGIPAIEYSEDQKTLISYSNMYDNILEHPECPDCGQRLHNGDPAGARRHRRHQPVKARTECHSGCELTVLRRYLGTLGVDPRDRPG